MSATGNATASTSTNEQPLANQNTAHCFDPLLTRYASKAEFIDTSATKSAQQGFRLWVGEGRNLMDPEGAAAGRVELTCYKFKVKDAKGKKTRVGGCRFSLKAVMEYDKDVEIANREWKFVAGLFVHNHDCGPPLSSPKKFGIRPARVLPPGKKANKGKKSEIPDATTMPTPETSQSPPEEKEEDQLAEYSESDYSTKVPPTGPRSVGSVIGEARDISVFEASGGEEQAEQRRSRTSSVILDEASLVSAILGPSSLPIDHTTLLSCDDTSIHFLAVDFPSPLHPSPLPIDHTTLLSFDQPAPPVHDSSHFIHVPATNRSIEEFLRSAGKNLEQYSTGFAVAGYDDFDSLLRVSDEAISRFLTSDLLALCPSLFTNLYHQQLVTSLVVAHRLERNAPFFQNADEVLGRLFHDPDLPPILSPIEDIPVELGTSRGTKRSFDDVFDELDHSNSLNYH